MINDDESDMISGLCNGSKKAFEEIFYRYHQRIYNFCLRLLSSHDDAEEIVQNVFVALWEQKSQIDVSKPVLSYLFSIARYMVYSELRKLVYRKAVYEEIVLNETVFKETTKDDVLFNELRDVIQQLVNRLPQRQKEIFGLSRFSGLSYKEIAQKLGITENTVDTQIRRSLAYLRKEYERYYNR